MDRSPALRVGDREREQVADELRRHAAAGRLDRAYAARTAADLAPLTEDLPALDAPKPPARPLSDHAKHAVAVARI